MIKVSATVQDKLKELNLTAEDVLRKALDIHAAGIDVGQGVFLPEGASILGYYDNYPYQAIVRNGQIIVREKIRTAAGETKMSETSHNTLSGAAASITGRKTTNGWEFWKLVKLPAKNEFAPIMSFRDRPKL